MSDNLKAAEFYPDVDPDTTFSGYTKGDTWNGWACPYFEKDVAEQVAEHYSQEDQYDHEEEYWAEYIPEEDAFAFHNHEYEEPREFGAVAFDGHKLYPIGAYCWTWVEVDE
ncbi:hypothetical protein [Salinibacter grassmerensis]|uniref:hypothetical protein n=1 Tax=Salinibacter grassmerensis TaxID=3040353 RepID=UPI0021E7A91E|nr:hypothetical protein [Salinibacter grassmerensis]